MLAFYIAPSLCQYACLALQKCCALHQTIPACMKLA